MRREATARTLEEIATENAVEGCVRETFGALVAHWQTRETRDPVVRATMRRIARDETCHAALSWSIDAWARSRLHQAARTRVDEAPSEAARALIMQAGRSAADRGMADAGLPLGPRARVLAESLRRSIFA